MNLKKRSTLPELLDADDLPTEALYQNLHELAVINRWLGGHAVSLKGLHKICKQHNSKEISIIDLGCGGGDLLYAIQQWAVTHDVKVRLAGLDVKPQAFDYMLNNYPTLKNIDTYAISFADAAEVVSQYDVAIASLVYHHLYADELDQLLHLMMSAKLGFVINDLHRHWLAYHSIKWLTAAFSRSHLVKHDAPLSVAKAFTKSELMHLLEKNGCHHYQIYWQWAFRWLVVASAPHTY